MVDELSVDELSVDGLSLYPVQQLGIKRWTKWWLSDISANDISTK
jgi:hypothetical protein